MYISVSSPVFVSPETNALSKFVDRSICGPFTYVCQYLRVIIISYDFNCFDRHIKYNLPSLQPVVVQ